MKYFTNICTGALEREREREGERGNKRGKWRERERERERETHTQIEKYILLFVTLLHCKGPVNLVIKLVVSRNGFNVSIMTLLSNPALVSET